jgi:hypothetical protein
MPGQRRTVGSRSRRSWLPVLAGIGAIVVLAGAGAAVYVVKFHPATPRHPPPLPTRVASYQTVGLVAQPAQPGGPRGVLLQLLSPQGTPMFSPVGQAQQVTGQPEWTADLMAGGTYIFIYLPSGQCLASAGSAGRLRLALRHCVLSTPQQRWRRLSTPVLQGGHEFYQFASAASGKCIAQLSAAASQPGGAGLASCDPTRPASQLLAFWWTSQ